MASFSNDTKNEIIGLDIKGKKCCLFSFLYGMMFCSQSENNANYIKTTIAEKKLRTRTKKDLTTI